MMVDAEKRASSLGLRSFSAYVQQLIREDLARRGDMVLREQPSAGEPPIRVEKVDSAVDAAVRYSRPKKPHTPV